MAGTLKTYPGQLLLKVAGSSHRLFEKPGDWKSSNSNKVIHPGHLALVVCVTSARHGGMACRDAKVEWSLLMSRCGIGWMVVGEAYEEVLR